MNEELTVLCMVAQRLEKQGIAYLISGSMAANYYTIPRMTRDIDIVIELGTKNVGRFVKNFQRDFWIDLEMVASEVEKRGMFNMIHREYVLKVDFIIRKDSAFQESAFRRRKKVVIEGCPVWFISPEDLILAKLLWAKDSLSELQMVDVRHLLSSVKDLDQKYLAEWISTLGLEEIFKKVGHD